MKLKIKPIDIVSEEIDLINKRLGIDMRGITKEIQGAAQERLSSLMREAMRVVKYKTDKLYRKQLHLVEEMHSRITRSFYLSD